MVESYFLIFVDLGFWPVTVSAWQVIKTFAPVTTAEFVAFRFDVRNMKTDVKFDSNDIQVYCRTGHSPILTKLLRQR